MAAKERRGRVRESVFLHDLKHACREDHIEHARRHHHDAASWQSRVLEFVHSSTVEWVLFGLLVLEVLSIFVELFLEAEYPACSYVVRDAVCGDGRAAACDDEKYPLAHALTEILEYISPFILATFMLENLALLVALDAREFFGNVLYALDFVVVSVSILLEAYDWLAEANSGIADFAQLIIVVRLWRFVSLCYNLLTMQKEGDADRIEQLERRLRENGIAAPPRSQLLSPVTKVVVAEGEVGSGTTLPTRGDGDYHEMS